jgi:hypothetical protein
MTIYDLRTDDDQAGFIASVNAGLRSEPDKKYFTAHGDIGSDHWWQDFDAGLLPHKVRAGAITHVGFAVDEFTGEDCDIVRFYAHGRDHEYDREGFWLHPSIKMGNIITITTTMVEIATSSGPVTYLVDVKVEVEECQQAASLNAPQALQSHFNHTPSAPVRALNRSPNTMIP